MDIKELIVKLFGEHPKVETTIIDRWVTYQVPPGYMTAMRLKELFDRFTVYGQSNTGEKLIIAGGVYVVVKYPALENRHLPIEVSVREDNLRPAFLNDMSEEEDFEKNRTNPKIAYGYIWREQVNKEVVKLWNEVVEEYEQMRQFKDYEADVKSWTLIESTMLNKQDAIPQIRNSFKPYIKVDTENGLLLTLPAGFIAFDKYANITIAMDYRVATGTLALLDKMKEGDKEAMVKLLSIFATEIIVTQGSYFAFDEVTLETSLLSSVGNSV